MLLYQFNTGSQLADPSKINMFNMGENRQEGGEKADADQQGRIGQLLQGGGLWWQGEQEKGQDAFGGFRADVKNASASPATPSITPQAIAAPPPAQGLSTSGQGGWAEISSGGMPGLPSKNLNPVSPMGDMLASQRKTWRSKATGVDNPMEF
jgi:hypothetical protein